VLGSCLMCGQHVGPGCTTAALLTLVTTQHAGATVGCAGSCWCVPLLALPTCASGTETCCMQCQQLLACSL
jgi:hypothetical protein